MKIDLIVTWPINNDYPIWREMIRGYRHKFNRVIVVFMNTNDGMDFSLSVRRSMALDGVDFINSYNIPSGGDWRSVAVNEGLRLSDADWVWFTEQDFFIREGFWEFINEDSDVIYTDDNGRMHPCCIFAKREVINKTKKNFGVLPGVLDHFGVFQKDIERMGVKTKIIPKILYYHMNGLSHNFTLIRNGEMPNYKPNKFNYYLRRCLDCQVPLDKQWLDIVNKYVESIQ